MNAQINVDSLIQVINHSPIYDSLFSSRARLLYATYKNEGDLKKGLSVLSKYRQIINQEKNQENKWLQYNKATIIELIGFAHQQKGKYSDALQCYIDVFNIYSKIDNKPKKIVASSHMANIYRLQKNPKKSLEINLQILKETDILNPIDAGMVYNLIGILYDFDFEKPDSAIYFYNKALVIYKSIQNKIGISTVSGNISGVFTLQKKYAEAIKYRREALKIDLETNDKEGQIYSYWGLALIFDEQLSVDSAENNYFIALAIAKNLQLNKEIYESYSMLSQFYAKNKKFEQAYRYQEEAKKISDQIYSTEMANSLTKMQTEFETQKKEQEIVLLQKDKVIKEGNITKQKQIIYGGLLAFSLVLLLLILFIKSNNDRKKINQILSHQKNELEKLSIVASETTNSVIITDAKGDIIWVNKGFEKMHDTTLDEIKNSGEINAIKLSSNKNLDEIFKDAIKNKHSINYVGQIFSESQKTQWIQTTLTPIYNNGIVDKIVFIDSDITLLKEAEEQITIQRNQLEIKNNHITESLDYAYKLQQAILPSTDSLVNTFSDFFIYFKPKDIVSGDFYLLKHIDDNVTLFAVIDCTGHGVPGAFMTIFTHNLLEMITNQANMANPSSILNQLNTKLYESLNSGNEKITDGMELTLCAYDKRTKIVTMSGAFSSIYHVRNNELTEIKGDLIIMGKPNAQESYTNKEIEIMENDSIYLFTDGYPDQKGGEKKKKFYYQPFKNLLLENVNQPMSIQKEKIDLTMTNWKQNFTQMDDMCILGVKF